LDFESPLRATGKRALRLYSQYDTVWLPGPTRRGREFSIASITREPKDAGDAGFGSLAEEIISSARKRAGMR